jgi:protein phosphatase
MDFTNMDHSALTHVGMKRGNNQDNLCAIPAANEQQYAKQGHLFLVADGMGGHLGGEKASEMASRIIPLTYSKLIGQAGASLTDSLTRAFSDANDAIHRKGHEGRDFFNMGTTCSCLIIRDDGAWVGHVGDSRIYLVRAGRIHQLTFDHSMVWQAAKDRGVDPDTVHDVMSNRILRCLGPERLVDVDIQGPYPIQPGDAFVLCSDGLSGFVADTEMAMAASILPAEKATNFLVTLANLRGGGDNISIVIAKVPGAIADGTRANLSEPELSATRKTLQYWIWVATALFGGLSFVGALMFFLMNEQGNEAIKVGLLATLTGFMISLLAGITLLVLDVVKQSSGNKSEEAHVPISRARKWSLSRSVIDSIRNQVGEILVPAEKLMEKPEIESIRLKLAAIKSDCDQGYERSAYLQAAETLSALLPVIEKMIRYQQIPAAPIVIPKPAI